MAYPKDQQAFLARETKNLPSNREALSSISAILSEFASVMDFTTHPTIWPYNENPLVTEKFDKGIQSIIIGEKDPRRDRPRGPGDQGTRTEEGETMIVKREE